MQHRHPGFYRTRKGNRRRPIHNHRSASTFFIVGRKGTPKQGVILGEYEDKRLADRAHIERFGGSGGLKIVEVPIPPKQAKLRRFYE